MKIEPLYFIIISAICCIPLVGIGMYLDFNVFNNHPFMNIGKWLGVVAVVQLAVVGALSIVLQNRSDDRQSLEKVE